jgi:hypothetical protein
MSCPGRCAARCDVWKMRVEFQPARSSQAPPRPVACVATRLGLRSAGAPTQTGFHPPLGHLHDSRVLLSFFQVVADTKEWHLL